MNYVYRKHWLNDSDRGKRSLGATLFATNPKLIDVKFNPEPLP
jgi:hypothetical protein